MAVTSWRARGGALERRACRRAREREVEHTKEEEKKMAGAEVRACPPGAELPAGGSSAILRAQFVHPGCF